MSERQSSEQQSDERQSLAVIFGGPSVEHTISVRSARAVIAAADTDRWRAVPIAVTREARWLSPAESVKLLARIDAGAPEEVGAEQTLSALEAAPHVAAATRRSRWFTGRGARTVWCRASSRRSACPTSARVSRPRRWR